MTFVYVFIHTSLYHMETTQGSGNYSRGRFKCSAREALNTESYTPTLIPPQPPHLHSIHTVHTPSYLSLYLLRLSCFVSLVVPFGSLKKGSKKEKGSKKGQALKIHPFGDSASLHILPIAHIWF